VSPSVRMPTTDARVDCGLGLVMLSFWPTTRLSSVDFPTLGTPTTATIPARVMVEKCNAPTQKADGGIAKGCRRRPTLPRSLDRSTIGAVGLNDRVRDGNECGPYALVASESIGTTIRGSDCGRTNAMQHVDRAVLCDLMYLGVVKPHGRLGPLGSKGFTAIPPAAYRRDGLSRPFRELEALGKVHLGGSFPLRCIQRLSPPAIATRRCAWRHSRDTSGQSDPVLSY
jgi:hypothetical protein